MALPFTVALWPGLVSSELLFHHLQKNEIYVKWLIWCPEYCRWPIKVHFLFSHKSELAGVELLDLLGTLIKGFPQPDSVSQRLRFSSSPLLSVSCDCPNQIWDSYATNLTGTWQHTLACLVLLSLLHSLLMWLEGTAPSLIQECGPHCLL